MVFLLALPSQAGAAKGVALVIGNSAYKYTGELPNPRNDASDMTAALRKLGFEVISGMDLDKAAMDRTIREFSTKLSGSATGLFFYAGHGLQVDGINYLVPIDAQLATAAALDFETVRLELVQRTMERESNTNILFLDACRDNPLARNLARAMGTRSVSIGRGLARAESGVGTLISYSTQPGNVALDGRSRNSPFTAALVRRIMMPGDDLSDILIDVRLSVMAATDNRQVPWEHSALLKRFYFMDPSEKSAKRDEVLASGNTQIPKSNKTSRDLASIKRSFYTPVGRSSDEIADCVHRNSNRFARGRDYELSSNVFGDWKVDIYTDDQWLTDLIRVCAAPQ